MRLFTIAIAAASAPAGAAELLVPSVYPDISRALAAAQSGDEIVLDDEGSGWDPALESSLTVRFDLTIRSDDDGRVQVPGLRVLSGATLTLEHLEVVGSALGEWTEDGSSVNAQSAAVFVQGGALRGADVALTGSGGVGLFVYDGDVELSGLYASNYEEDRAVRVISFSQPTRLALSGCDFGGNGGGAISAIEPALALAGADVDLTLGACAFYDNSAQNGADILAYRATVEVNNASSFDRSAATAGGGSIWAEESDLSLSAVRFDSPTAPAGAAIVAHTASNLGNSVTLDDVDISGAVSGSTDTPGGALRLINVITRLEDVRAVGAGGAGGAVLYQENGQFFASHLHIQDYTVGSLGGAISLVRNAGPWSDMAEIRFSRFCSGVGTAGGEGLVLHVENYALLFSNNVVVRSEGADLAGIYLSGIRNGATVAQNTFTRNSLASVVQLNETTATLTNNILDWGSAGVTLDDASSSLSGGYNLWNNLSVEVVDNGGTADAFTGAVRANPLYWLGYAPDDCYSDPLLALGSPAIDAGDPSIFDGDDTRSDIGAYGGPDVRLPDLDADGWPRGLDCDDGAASVHPEAEEVVGNGIDEDCDGADTPANDDTGPDDSAADDSAADDSAVDDSGGGPMQLLGGCRGCEERNPPPDSGAAALLVFVALRRRAGRDALTR